MAGRAYRAATLAGETAVLHVAQFGHPWWIRLNRPIHSFLFNALFCQFREKKRIENATIRRCQQHGLSRLKPGGVGSAPTSAATPLELRLRFRQTTAEMGSWT
jgi:hypothetical protein